MPKASKTSTRAKAANNRRKLFVEAYLANGRNGTQAAIAAGYSAKTAAVKASQLLTEVKIAQAIDARAEKLQAAMELTTENVLRELARIALFDPATLYDAEGKLLPVHQMPADTRAAIASLEVDQTAAGEKTIINTSKIKLHDKNSALEKGMRHLGLFEKDNRQRPPVAVTVELVG